MLSSKVAFSLQLKEVDEHKYFLSEKKGYDIGMDLAMADWALVPDYDHSHAARFRSLLNKYETRILQRCQKYCGGSKNCSMINCPLSLDELHEILEDSPVLV